MAINMQINPDRYQSIYSFFKTPKMQFTSEQRIFVVTNYLKTRSFKEVHQLFEHRFRDSVLPTEMTIWKNVKSTTLKDEVQI